MADPDRTRVAGVRQVSVLSAGRILAAVISAVWFVLAARNMSVRSFGSLALLLSIGMVTAFLGDLGLSGLLSNLVGHRPEVARSAVAAVLVRRVPLSIVASFVTMAAYVLAGGIGGWWIAVAFAPSLVATACHGTVTTALRSVGDVHFDAGNEVCSRIFVLAIGALVLAGGGGLAAVVLVYVVADVASAIVLAVLFVRRTKFATRTIDHGDVSFAAARNLGVTGVINTLYFRIDLWLVALFDGDKTVGRYAVAYRLFEGMLLPATAIAALSIPHTAGLHGDSLRHELRRLARMSVLITAPIALGTLACAPWLISTLFGERYLAAVPALRLLSLAAVCTAVTAVVLPPLALRSSKVAVAMGLALAMNIGGNLVAIPHFGANGAAAVTLICEIGLMVWALHRVNRSVYLDDCPPPLDPDALVRAIAMPYESERP